MLNQPVKNT